MNADKDPLVGFTAAVSLKHGQVNVIVTSAYKHDLSR